MMRKLIAKIEELPREQQIMLAIMAVGLLAVFWYYMISPRQAELQRLEGEITRLTTEVQKGQAVQARLPQFKKEVKELEGRLAELSEVLPDQKETAEIVRRIERLAVDSKLDIKSFQPQATVRNDFYEDWPIRISLEGNYNNLGLFFERIALFRRIINVSDISIRSLNSANPDRTLAATCTATTFVLVEQGK